MLEDKKSILIIDDEEIALEFFRELLKVDDYAVSVARSGEEGLRILRARPVHLVIVDKNLPGLSGFEVINAIRKFNPGIAMIMISGYSSTESVIEAIKLGVVDYFTKPFEDVAAIRGKIRMILEIQDKSTKFQEHMSRLAHSNEKLRGQIDMIRKKIEGGS